MRNFIDKVAARAVSAGLARFAKQPLALQPDDLRQARISFSQFAEDLVVVEHLIHLRRPRGIYVDAGCFDPVRFSNTRLLHLLGWRGVNVDASPEAISVFGRARPDDHNVCAALSDRAEQAEFLSTSSGASSRLAEFGRPFRNPSKEITRRTVITETLADILDASPFASSPVDFLDIDCEGADLKVLAGFGLEQRRPALICIEAHDGIGEERALGDYLGAMRYRQVSRCGLSLIFRDADL